MDLRFSWLFAVLLGGFALLSLSSCDDSSTVGLGVGADSLDGGEPNTANLVPDLDTTTVAPQTGRQLSPVPGQNTRDSWRFLVGRVDDPIGGTIAANGYLDVLGHPDLPESLLEAEADSLSAELRFRNEYLHGDSLSSVDVRIEEIASEADMQGAPADSSFETGAQVTTASIDPSDSLVTVDLPRQWVAENASVLRDTTEEGSSFQEDFHGFKLVSTGGNAVVGFSSTTATLRVHLVSDTTTATDYPAFKTFSHVERHSAPTPPENRFVLQDGAGTNLAMTWRPDSLERLKNSPLNRAEIYVPIDTTTLQENSGSESFVRPVAKGFRIIATRAPGPDTPPCSSLPTARVSDNERECGIPMAGRAAPSAAVVPTNIARAIFETTLLNEPVFTEYRLSVADRQSTDVSTQTTLQPGLPSTLPVLVPDSEATDMGSPTLSLTYTQL